MDTPTSYAHLRAVPVPFQALVEAGITPNQWCLLYLMHFKLDQEHLAYLTAPDAPQGWNPDELNDLHDRFYLIYEPQPGDHPKLSPANFRVSERFTDLLGILKPAALTAKPAIPLLSGEARGARDTYPSYPAPSHTWLRLRRTGGI